MSGAPHFPPQGRWVHQAGLISGGRPGAKSRILQSPPSVQGTKVTQIAGHYCPFPVCLSGDTETEVPRRDSSTGQSERIRIHSHLLITTVHPTAVKDSGPRQIRKVEPGCWQIPALCAIETCKSRALREACNHQQWKRCGRNILTSIAHGKP